MIRKRRPLTRMALAGGLITLAGVAAWTLAARRQEIRLVRVDPDTAAADSTSMTFAVPRGRALFAHHCAACHGLNGQGSNTLGSANLTDHDWLYGEGTAADIETVVRYGIRAPNSRSWRLADMPAFAQELPYAREPSIKALDPKDINDVIQFLRLLEKRPADGDSARRGAGVYETAGCYDCHGTHAAGDSAIGAPNLTDAIWLYGDGSTAWMYDSIAFGRAGVCPAWAEQLSAVQIREVALYVYSLSKANIR